VNNRKCEQELVVMLFQDKRKPIKINWNHIEN